MTRRLKEAVGNILKISKEQEDCLDQDLIISFHHPLNLICYCFDFEVIEFKSSRIDQEAMGSEEDDETFVRRNKLLQEAITKQVMEAMVKLLEEKYDQRPNDGQGQASGQRREQRRNRQGQREHAGSEETDNFYERRSHSSGSRHSNTLAEEEAVLAIPTGPITRAMTRRLKEAVGNILKISKEQGDLSSLLVCNIQRPRALERLPREPVPFNEFEKWSLLLVCNIQRPRALERCVISDLSLGVSRSLSAASCVTIRSTYLEKLDKRSSPSSNLVSSSKTSTHSFEDSIRKAISQAFRDVEKQLKQSKTISPSLEVQNQAPSSTVSELKDAEPDSVAQSDLAALVQEDQTEIPTITIQKDDQPIKDDLILFKQDVIEEEAPMESKSDSGVEHLFVTDSNGFQRTFLGTFLISPFVWNKTRAVELSRHQLGMEHVVFEPGGELWNHRNNPLVIEKKSAATTIVFGDLLPSEAKGMHVSAQQEFHYETNWRMLPTLSWIEQTRKRSKWPPDHQDIVNSAKHIGLAKFCELLISDWGGRLQFYLWKPGAYSRILIILGECSARSRTSWDNKELEADQNALLLDHVKVWKPPDLQKLQYHFRDCQTKSGDGDFTRLNGEVITGIGGELMFSSQIKEKPPDELSLHQSPNKPTRGNYLDSKKRMKPDLLSIGTGQTVMSTRIFEKRGYSIDQSIKKGSLAKLEMQLSNLGSCLAANFDIGAVRGSYLSNQKELSNKLNCNGNYTHQGLTSNWNHVQSLSNERVMGSTRRVILCLLCLNFSEFRTSQSYLWRPGEHAKVTNHVFKSSFIDYTDMMHLFLPKESCAEYMEALKHTKGKNKREEDKRFKPPDLSQERHQDITKGACSL
ncbi:hypothetical protein IGI04_007647 [Brassica rapa subsp. trilocularis]|uniref:Uncharacterized protein n=1 Tax=Brassica rapa subsp. trilocularis TaxID=1813537 RepID=A0ABQ7NKP3_BRACM|nr:hypothetical protein IGI04_007647 [Brassica rapa subsp. trilocularis]